MTLDILGLDGKRTGSLELEAAVWKGPVNRRLLNQVVAMYRTNQRAGTASTKRRGEVSGGGKKPWKQKHTGRARAGSIRSPLWRGGGIVFGPKPRTLTYTLPQRMRQRALLESLKGKVQDDELVVVDALEASTPKTKPFGRLRQTFGVSGKGLVVLEGVVPALMKSLRNLNRIELRQATSLNAFDVLNAQKVIVTKAAFSQLTQRVQGSTNASTN